MKLGFRKLGLIQGHATVVVVDAKFCPGYCVYFLFGPRAHLWRGSNLDLEPCHFLSTLSSLLSHLVLVIYFVSNRYLSCCVVSFRIVPCFCIYLR